ncbi:saccharopine dehydrogenase NADP-binding domain-containing protein [Kribbella sp.]|uniref:saccharopine dehydrogenase NADP-binding domain-containing protein n=1 Tax=Kribbella sp. TaxID=1871183 RepID=UPI002D30FDCA|nr:saccharopine dehydrogenase NADP-binding domain-containing protein [Kribbella sp.]HZX06058.1 saccharopine dehydrogenase NADP-binding domain-containing protein [Kribbella sp.]
MNAIVVYGATGHTGRFVVEELRRQHLPTAVSGRNATALAELWGDLDVRPAAVDDPHALDLALKNAAAVINCAGPFAVTAAPLIEAAARQRIPYVDVAAEIEANVATFARHSDVPVVPAMAFFGGLGDLLATAVLEASDVVQVAYGLSSWHPTPGTRVAGQVSHERRNGRRVRFADGRLQYHQDPPIQEDWTFPEPLGRRRVFAEFSMADIVTIPSHLDVPEVRTYMTVEAAGDLAEAQAPVAVDEQGRSDQTFTVDVRVGDARATAAGQDIYAISAPLAVGAVRRILGGETRAAGVASAGAMFDAVDFLRELPLALDLG